MTHNSDTAAISISKLSKAFGPQKVLDGIDLEVPRGKTLAVLGRSGTGKSVLLKLIIGLQKPDGGSIEIFGQEVTRLATDELNQIRKRIGFLFQHAALYDSLTVEENVAFPLRRHTPMKDDEIRDRVRELLARVGMEKDLKKMPADLSGGMKKRVGLARALALDPEIMLLDEPTAGLDPITARTICELAVKLRDLEDVSSIFVTHRLQDIEVLSSEYVIRDDMGNLVFEKEGDRMCLINTKFIMLKDGDVIFSGTDEQLRKSDDPYIIKFLDNDNLKRK